MKKSVYISKLLFTNIFILSSLITQPASAVLSPEDKVGIGTEITTIYRAARGVVAKNQKLINDASIGDKGLSADVVLAKTKENYKKATGKDFKIADPIQHEDLFKIAEENIKDIEQDENNFKKYDFLLKLFDKADIINQINLENN